MSSGVTNSNAKNSKKIWGFSLSLGVYLSLVLSFCYVYPQSGQPFFLSRIQDYLGQVFGGYGLVQSLLALLLSASIYFTLNHMQNHQETFRPLLAGISFLFGFFNVCGLFMYYLDDLPFFDSGFWIVMTLFLLAGWAVLFYLLAYWILFGFQYVSLPEKKESAALAKGFMAVFSRHPGRVSFLVILLCWLPWIVVYYPASMDWDVYRQLCSAMSLGQFARSNHDPWLASCILNFFYQLGVKMGSQNLGIFLFVIVRAPLMAGIYAFCVRQLKKADVRSGICIAVLLYYAVTPVWGAYAKHAFKDTLGAALFCGYMISLVTVILRTDRETLRLSDCLVYCFFAAITSLTRNNPIYAILPGTIFLVIYLVCRKADWRKCVVVLLGVVFCFGYNYYIFHYGNVSKGSSAEAMSILFQQTARTVKYHADEITEEERQVIDDYLDYSTMASDYDPVLSDPIKNRCKGNAVKENAAGNYLTVWAQMFFKYPDTYFEALIGNSYGYYSFTPKLPDGAGNMNSGMTIFHWIRVPQFDEFGFDFHYLETKTLDAARSILHTWSKVWDSLPIVSLTDTIAVYTWLVILIGYELLRRKKWPHLITIMVMGIMILTCVASPVNDCFRYYSPVAASVPVLLLLLEKSSAGKSVLRG